MPELTVSMPAYNAGDFISESIRSVLGQERVDFELIVVDDGSQDNTREVTRSFDDPRIRLIRNQTNKGAAYCHNLVIEESRAPFIAHVDSGALVLPGAFQRMVNEIKNHSNVGQAACYYFIADENGIITRGSFHEQRKYILENITADMDCKRELLSKGVPMKGLRIYRKEVFKELGKFDEHIGCWEDYDMALRIMDKFDIKLVPEFLYCYRLHKNNFTPVRRTAVSAWRRHKLNILQKLPKANGIRWLTGNRRRLYGLRISGLYGDRRVRKISRSILALPGRARDFMARRVFIPLLDRIYLSIDGNFSWWPIGLFNYKKRAGSDKEKRIAYYLWHFPVLSQTFIQREIEALRKSGLSVDVISDAPEDTELLNENAKSLIENTSYLSLEDKNTIVSHRKHFFLQSPLLYINLFLYVVFHRYEKNKSFKEDAAVFSRAVSLAGVLKERGISHIHSPWADRCAFVALVASKLAGISYSVQGRAHDIHRKTYLYAFPEKFENAEFVITNTRYNKQYLESFLNGRPVRKIDAIYNGLDLAEFTPDRKQESTPKEIRIISVARLIEQKGLVYLLKACRILKERGCSFRCEIIGGPEEPLYINYNLALKKLHRKLGLEDCVFFLGAQSFDNILDAYRSSHIFVLPCVIAEDGSRDITPNSLIEAMAMKLPVVSTNVTGVPEIVEDGISGILIPPKDADALAGAIVKLIEDDNLRKELGENARKRVEERFDISKNIVKYVALFKEQIY